MLIGSIIFGIQTQVASKVSNTNSDVEKMYDFKQLVLIFFPTLVLHKNCNLPQKYAILIPM
jgi:hypothetical protein